jgi:hypothetical protein
MSQRNVEQILGRLLTDERFRESFATDPSWTLQDLVEKGVALTVSERTSLANTDILLFEWMSRGLSPRLQKAPARRKPPSEGPIEGACYS